MYPKRREGDKNQPGTIQKTFLKHTPRTILNFTPNLLLQNKLREVREGRRKMRSTSAPWTIKPSNNYCTLIRDPSSSRGR